MGLLDRNGLLTMMNTAGARLLNGRPEDFIGRSVTALLPAQGEVYLRRIQKVFETQATEFFDDELDLPSGRKWISTTFQALKEADGTVWAVQIVGIDTTDSHRYIAELLQTRQDLSEAQRIARIGSWHWEIATDKVVWSDEIYRIFGLEHQTPSYALARAATHPDDTAFWEASVRAALYASKPFCIDYRVVRPDGRIVWIHNEARIRRDEDGMPLEMFGTAQDVTDRKELEQALEKKERLYVMAEQIAHLGIWERDFDDDSAHWSQGGFAIFGLPEAPEAPSYDQYLSMVHPDDRLMVDQWVRRVRAGRVQAEIEYRIVRPDGEPRIVRSIMCPVQSAKGPGVNLFGLIQDITQRRGLQTKIHTIAETERIAVRRELHDTVCQHLTAIHFLSDDAAREVAGGRTPAKADLDLITSLTQTALEQAKAIARNLEPLPSEPGALSGALREVADHVRAVYKIDCRAWSPKAVRIADSRITTQLLLIAREAAVNAAKHAYATKIRLSLAQKKGSVELQVSDDGMGLDAGAESDSGLGMGLMRERADLIGATLEISSGKKKGTTIRALWNPNESFKPGGTA
jgi:PAS domain S-box-containing protein